MSRPELVFDITVILGPGILVLDQKPNRRACCLTFEYTRGDAVIVERISVLGENEVMKVKMLVTKDWKMLHYGSAPYGELYNVKNDPEDLHNLWDVSDYADVRQQLTERLLAELIDSELGDPKVVLKAKGVGGTLRAQKCMEQEPEYRGDLSDRLDGIRNLNRSK